MKSSRSDIFEISAMGLAALIRDGRIRPSELIEAYISRLEAVNPKLNALVENQFAQARRAAREKDLILERTKDPASLPPFFGVPFTVKEMIAVAGCKRTAGHIHHRDDLRTENATVVDRLLGAGGILLGTTNVPELGFWFETDNPIHGRTNNPYDLRRTSGGSSGGESALIGAGASPLGLGSDIGGSIRMPATFCGIFGHKPTWKTIPITGHFSQDAEDLKKETMESYSYTTLGFLTRRAQDLRPLMQVLMGPDGIDPQTKANFRLKPEVIDFSKLKIFTLRDPQIFLCQRVDPELQDCVRRTGELFQQWGAEVIELDPKLFKNAAEIWGSSLMKKRSNTFSHKLTHGEPLNYLKEFFNTARGEARYMFTSLMTSLFEKWSPSSEKHEALKSELQAIDQRLKKLLGPHGLLILPPHPRVAPKHRSPWLTPFDFVLTGIFNILGYPATSVPMGLNSEGLPLGVQIVALPFADHLNFSVAEALESAFGGWTAPSGVQSIAESITP